MRRTNRGPAGQPGPASAPRTFPHHHYFDFADSLRQVLELYGHHLDIAMDGPSGLKLAASKEYAAIVCDIGLPGMDGYEVAHRLRGERATSRVTMIALTAYSSEEAIRQSREAGFDAHLVKSAPLEDVLSALGIQIPAVAA